MTRRSSNSYLHGTAPAEQDRLSRLNDLLNAASLREMQLRGRERILDLGCGLGQLTRAMARAVAPRGRVVGVERSPEQIAAARRLASEVGEETLFEIRQGEVPGLPLAAEERGRFDLAHARFLLEHTHDPRAVVAEMVSAVRPGGRIILEDDNHDAMRLWPEPPGFRSLWGAYVRTYDRLGNDPYVGHRLVSLLHEAGAKPVRSTWIFFGGCSGEATFSAHVDNLIGVVDSAREHIIGDGLLSTETYELGIESLVRWKARPDAALWFAISWAEGRRPSLARESFSNPAGSESAR